MFLDLGLLFMRQNYALSALILRSVNWAPRVVDIYIYIVMMRLKVQAF